MQARVVGGQTDVLAYLIIVAVISGGRLAIDEPVWDRRRLWKRSPTG
jgi:hypothetical protein